MTTTQDTTRQVYRVFIKASAEQIWEAITRPEFTARYFHGARITVTPDRYRSLGTDDAVWADASVYTFEPPHRLVHGWVSRYDDVLAKEPESRVTWEIAPAASEGVCMLTVTHDQLERSPGTADSVRGAGWTFVISGLKTLLETGESL
jgi:uncharacterized protein YndB with AHSA1/START domain